LELGSFLERLYSVALAKEDGNWCLELLSTVVNSPQPQPVAAYKKKHSSNHQKYFLVLFLHDFNESPSIAPPLAPPVLKGRRTRETAFPEPDHSI